MTGKLDYQSIVSEFESHCVLRTSGLVDWFKWYANLFIFTFLV